MQEKYNQLKTLLGEIADLRHTAALLEWDQQTYMPEGAAEARGRQIATISTIAHNKSTSTEPGKLLDELKPWAEEHDPGSTEYRLVKVALRDYLKEVRVPADYVEEFSIVTTAACMDRGAGEIRLCNIQTAP
jgi:carboxypeptidase Taq